MNKCAKCDYELNDRWRFCGRCGWPCPAAPAGEAAARPSPADRYAGQEAISPATRPSPVGRHASQEGISVARGSSHARHRLEPERPTGPGETAVLTPPSPGAGGTRDATIPARAVHAVLAPEASPPDVGRWAAPPYGGGLPSGVTGDDGAAWPGPFPIELQVSAKGNPSIRGTLRLTESEITLTSGPGAWTMKPEEITQLDVRSTQGMHPLWLSFFVAFIALAATALVLKPTPFMFALVAAAALLVAWLGRRHQFGWSWRPRLELSVVSQRQVRQPGGYREVQEGYVLLGGRLEEDPHAINKIGSFFFDSQGHSMTVLLQDWSGFARLQQFGTAVIGLKQVGRAETARCLTQPQPLPTGRPTGGCLALPGEAVKDETTAAGASVLVRTGLWVLLACLVAAEVLLRQPLLIAAVTVVGPFGYWLLLPSDLHSVVTNRRWIIAQRRDWWWYKVQQVSEFDVGEILALQWRTKALCGLPGRKRLLPFAVALDLLTTSPRLQLPAPSADVRSRRGVAHTADSNTSSVTHAVRAGLVQHVRSQARSRAAFVNVYHARSRAFTRRTGRALFDPNFRPLVADDGTAGHGEVLGRQLGPGEHLQFPGPGAGSDAHASSQLRVTTQRAILHRSYILPYVCDSTWEFRLTPGVGLATYRPGKQEMILESAGQRTFVHTANSAGEQAVLQPLNRLLMPIVSMQDGQQLIILQREFAALAEGEPLRVPSGQGVGTWSAPGPAQRPALADEPAVEFPVRLCGRRRLPARISITRRHIILRGGPGSGADGAVYWSRPIEDIKSLLRYYRGDRCDMVLVTVTPDRNQAHYARRFRNLYYQMVAAVIPGVLLTYVWGSLALPALVVGPALVAAWAVSRLVMRDVIMLDETGSYPVVSVNSDVGDALDRSLNAVLLALRETGWIDPGRRGPEQVLLADDTIATHLAPGERTERWYQPGSGAEVAVTGRRLLVSRAYRGVTLVQDQLLEDLAGLEEHEFSGRGVDPVFAAFVVPSVVITAFIEFRIGGFFTWLAAASAVYAIACAAAFYLSPRRVHFLVTRSRSMHSSSRTASGRQFVVRRSGNTYSPKLREYSLGPVPPFPAGYRMALLRRRARLLEIPAEGPAGDQACAELGCVVAGLAKNGTAVFGQEALQLTARSLAREQRERVLFADRQLAGTRCASSSLAVTDLRVIGARTVTMDQWTSSYLWQIPVDQVRDFLPQDFYFRGKVKAGGPLSLVMFVLCPIAYLAYRFTILGRHALNHAGFKGLQVLRVSPDPVAERRFHEMESVLPFEPVFGLRLPQPPLPTPLHLLINQAEMPSVLAELSDVMRVIHEGAYLPGQAVQDPPREPRWQPQSRPGNPGRPTW